MSMTTCVPLAALILSRRLLRMRCFSAVGSDSCAPLWVAALEPLPLPLFPPLPAAIGLGEGEKLLGLFPSKLSLGNPTSSPMGDTSNSLLASDMASASSASLEKNLALTMGAVAVFVSE